MEEETEEALARDRELLSRKIGIPDRFLREAQEKTRVLADKGMEAMEAIRARGWRVLAETGDRNHPDVVRARNEIAAAQRAIIEEIGHIVSRAILQMTIFKVVVQETNRLRQRRHVLLRARRWRSFRAGARFPGCGRRRA